MTTWVIPTLYPANPCTVGVPVYSGHEPYLGTELFARFLGLYARDPLRGLLYFGMFQSTLRATSVDMPDPLPGEPARSGTLRRTRIGHDIERRAVLTRRDGKQLDGGSGGQRDACLLIAPATGPACTGCVQSSLIDPDSSTLSSQETGSLHWRWPNVSIRSSSCHPVVTSTTPQSTSPLRKEGSTCCYLVPSAPSRRGFLIHIYCFTRDIP